MKSLPISWKDSSRGLEHDPFSFLMMVEDFKE
jgi:hypothetical protein